MNLLQRLKYTIESDLALTPKADNPLARLNQYIKEAEMQTEQTKTFLERQAALKQQLEIQLNDVQQMLAKRTEQLALAEQAGEMELIAFAQAERDAYETRSHLLQQSIEITTKELIALEQKYELMKHKIEDMKIRQLQVMGYENNARANFHMDAMLHPETHKDLSTMDDMYHYVDQLASPTQVINAQSSLEDRLDALQKKSLQLAKDA